MGGHFVRPFFTILPKRYSKLVDNICPFEPDVEEAAKKILTFITKGPIMEGAKVWEVQTSREARKSMWTTGSLHTPPS